MALIEISNMPPWVVVCSVAMFFGSIVSVFNHSDLPFVVAVVFSFMVALGKFLNDGDTHDDGDTK